MEERIKRMMPLLNERLLRQYLANEAKSYGRGGITLVSQISGVSRTTITAGIKELKNGEESSNMIFEFPHIIIASPGAKFEAKV
jgi:hypothetical protein